MGKFCGKCGSPLDKKTGLCPNCDRAKIAKIYLDELRKRQIKIFLLVFTVVLSVLLGALIVKNNGWKQRKQIIEKTNYSEANLISFPNGDSVYVPEEGTMVIDDATGISYYNNLILVYTSPTATEEDIGKIEKSSQGMVVGKINGMLDLLQIRVDNSDIEKLTSVANELMNLDSVIYATFDEAVICDKESILDENPWSKDGKKAEKDRGNEANPSGNDWWAEAIGAYTAWEYSDQCTPFDIGIIEMGNMEVKHEDLSGKVTVLASSKTSEHNSHGTHVAAIIGAKNNNIGVRGIADRANLLYAGIQSPDKTVDIPLLLSTTKEMIRRGAKVINCSWGRQFTASLANHGKNINFEERLENSYDTGVVALLSIVNIMQETDAPGNLAEEDFLIVHSAGNGIESKEKGWLSSLIAPLIPVKGIPAIYNGYYAAIDETAYNKFLSLISGDDLYYLGQNGVNLDSILDHVLVVGAVENKQDGNGNYYMTSFSNYGETVDICAPGKNIFSAVGESEYAKKSGTSQATPMVSGAAAFVWALDPHLNAGEVKQLLLSSATTNAVGVGGGKGFNYPMLNVGAAVQKLMVPTRSDNGRTEFSSFPSAFDVYCCSHDGDSAFNLNPDGTFTWVNEWWDWGSQGDGYPNGTCEISTLNGKFTDLAQVDEYTYKMSLDYVEQSDEVGQEYIENNARYVVTEDTRLSRAKEFYIYLPGTKYDIDYMSGGVSANGKFLFTLPPWDVDWENLFANGCVLYIDTMPALISAEFNPNSGGNMTLEPSIPYFKEKGYMCNMTELNKPYDYHTRSRKDASIPEMKSPYTMNITDTVEVEKFAETKKTIKEAGKETLTLYIDVIQKIGAKSCELGYFSWASNYINNGMLYDMDDDNIPELLVVYGKENEYLDIEITYDLYTIKNGKLVTLAKEETLSSAGQDGQYSELTFVQVEGENIYLPELFRVQLAVDRVHGLSIGVSKMRWMATL